MQGAGVCQAPWAQGCFSFLTNASFPQIQPACWVASSLPGGRGEFVFQVQDFWPLSPQWSYLSQPWLYFQLLLSYQFPGERRVSNYFIRAKESL